jgi:hypothetical protein
VRTWEWFVVGIAVGIAASMLIGLVGVGMRHRRRRKRLRSRFGPEYYRAVSSAGKRRAERRLADVERTHEELPARPLSGPARERYLEEWRQAEARFVSDPVDATQTGERIVIRILEERGYPTTGSIDERAAHIAADFPDLAERYRHAREMLASTNGGPSTENLRKAMVDFRTMLDELLLEEPAVVSAAD